VEIFTAEYPSPFRRNLWAGSTERAVSSSGAPRNVLGMKSRKVWVTAMEIMRIESMRGVVSFRRVADREMIRAEMRFMWMPGVRPVITPNVIPSRIERVISRSIKRVGDFI
jgi:hypothetical protein